VLAATQACEAPPPEAFVEDFMGMSYHYQILARSEPLGEGDYQPEGSDSIVFPPTEFTPSSELWWIWEDTEVALRLRMRNRAYLLVRADNLDGDLLQSDTNCPPYVGWTLAFDAVTGAVLSLAPGVGCLVC